MPYNVLIVEDQPLIALNIQDAQSRNSDTILLVSRGTCTRHLSWRKMPILHWLT